MSKNDNFKANMMASFLHSSKSAVDKSVKTKPVKKPKEHKLQIKKVQDESKTKSKPKVHHAKKSFMQLKKKPKVQYENIRLKQSVFNKLRKAQYANNISSRSKLLDMMYDYCHDALYASNIAKKRAKKFDKIEKAKK